MYKDPQRARLDAVFQGEASFFCGVVAQPRLVGRETEVKVVCNQPGLWNSGGGGGPIGYSLMRHAGQSAFRLVLLGTSCCYSSMPISQPSSSCHRESVTPEN